MITLNLGNAVGHMLKKADGSWRRITAVDPYDKGIGWSGFTVLYNTLGQKTGGDPQGGWMSWDAIKQHYDVEIVPTPEEAAMIERGRLSHQVAERATALAESIDAWLKNESSR